MDVDRSDDVGHTASSTFRPFEFIIIPPLLDLELSRVGWGGSHGPIEVLSFSIFLLFPFCPFP